MKNFNVATLFSVADLNQTSISSALYVVKIGNFYEIFRSAEAAAEDCEEGRGKRTHHTGIATNNSEVVQRRKKSATRLFSKVYRTVFQHFLK